jgi:hypothetical protein
MVIARPDGVARHVDGYRFEEPKSDATKFTSTLKKLPSTVDLRGSLTPVRDHGETKSVVAHPVAAAYEYLLKRHRGDAGYDASRLFIYFNARAASGDEGEDGGASIAQAIASVTEYGACSARAWPFDLAQVVNKPSDAAYEEAAGFTIDEAALVPVELGAWKQALAEGNPIIFGIYLFESFDRQRQPGLVLVPTDNDLEREQGEHAMLCVGYCDADEVFIVRNSWGPGWGDEGYCYIPFEYMMDTELNLGDAWVLRQKDRLAPDQASWSEASVLDDVDTPLGRMDDAAWGALLDALGEYTLETRLALIFLASAEADADIPDSALGSIGTALDDAFQALGSPFEADRVLRAALSLIDEGALIDDSIGLIGEHFEEDSLTAIVRAAASGAGLDDLAGAEAGTLSDLVDTWLGGSAPREGGLVDGLPGEYGEVNYAGGVYGDDDEGPDDFGDGFGEVEE